MLGHLKFSNLTYGTTKLELQQLAAIIAVKVWSFSKEGSQKGYGKRKTPHALTTSFDFRPVSISSFPFSQI